MTRRPTQTQLEEQVTTILGILTKVADHIPELVRRAQHDAVDGFPRGISSDGSGQTSGKSGHPDPTAATATNKAPSDPTLSAILHICDWIQNTAQTALTVDGQLQTVMTVAENERGRKNDIPNCVNPNCGVSLHDQGSDGRGRAGRCIACYHWRRRNNNMDAPLDVVARRKTQNEDEREAS